MSDTDSSEHETLDYSLYRDTQSNYSYEDKYGRLEEFYEFEQNCVMTVLIIVLVLTLSALIYGVTSWCILKKFRNHRNYVYLNVILVNFLLYSMVTSYRVKYLSDLHIDFHQDKITFNLILFFGTVRHYWLLVISYMFYVDIVKVFNGDIRRKYLKSTLFGWGMPLIAEILGFVLFWNDKGWWGFIIAVVIFFISIFPLVVNCVIYVIILCSICRSFCSRAQTAAKNCRRLYIATVIFILTDLFLLANYVIHVVYLTGWFISPIVQIILTLLYYSHVLLLDVFLICVKSNRELWYAFIVQKLKKRSQEQYVNMRRIVGVPTV